MDETESRNYLLESLSAKSGDDKSSFTRDKVIAQALYDIHIEQKVALEQDIWVIGRILNELNLNPVFRQTQEKILLKLKTELKEKFGG